MNVVQGNIHVLYLARINCPHDTAMDLDIVVGYGTCMYYRLGLLVSRWGIRKSSCPYHLFVMVVNISCIAVMLDLLSLLEFKIAIDAEKHAAFMRN